MKDRRRIEAATVIRPLTGTNQPPEPSVAATVVDLTDRTVGLRVDAGVDVTPARMMELDLDGHWYRGRITWSRPGLRDTVIVAVELADAGAVTALRTALDQ